MKPIEQLTNIEKGKIIYDLFPDEMPQFLDYALGVSEYVQQDKDAIREKWDNDLFPSELWFDLAKETQISIQKWGQQLTKNSRLFSEQLFQGFNAAFMAHCLRLYTTTQKLDNKKFSIAVQLFF